MSYYLGVDTGASKSHALVADDGGRVLGFSEGGPGNWESIGWEGTRATLNEIIGRTTAQAGIGPGDLAAAGFGLAGYDWPEDHPPHEAIIRDLLPGNVPIELVNDALIGLWAGTDTGWGVVVAAGTSCNCYGRDAAGRIGRVVGASAFGEYAGAGELVWWAVQAVAHDWSRRGPATGLSAALASLVGATDSADLLAGLMRRRYVLGPDAAPLVFAVASEGDAVALGLVQRAGHELGNLALGVIRQLEIGHLAFDVVLAGSLYKGSPLIEDSLAEVVHAEAPLARPVRLEAPPVVGAVLMAMELAGHEPAAARPRLVEAGL
jgi:N-acetylglucosamine kinase-like BadF-type ATPase